MNKTDSGTLGGIKELEAFAEGYFLWLMDEVDHDEMHRSRQYSILLRHLYELEFTWTLPFDENRAEDGCLLRVRYAEEEGVEYHISWVEWPCSVLEMLYALSIRIDDTVMYDISEGDRSNIWFWMMIDNLGLGICRDSSWREQPGYWAEYVGEKVLRFLNREYSTDGFGSLFPMGKNTPENWSETEIWSQMNEYFLRKF